MTEEELRACAEGVIEFLSQRGLGPGEAVPVLLTVLFEAMTQAYDRPSLPAEFHQWLTLIPKGDGDILMH